MNFTKILVEQDAEVAIIRLNDPDTLNAIGTVMLEELAQAVDEAQRTSRALLLTGRGRGFSSGGNLSTETMPVDAAGLPDAGALLETHVNPLMARLADLSIPWIAAVSGPTVGVGCSIALSADLVVASETAYFLQAFAKIGLVPDGGSSWLLSRSIGRARAMEMMLLADRLPAAKALEWGLINRVEPQESYEAVALELARSLAEGPTKALGLIRRLGWAAADRTWTEALAAERDAQKTAGGTEDFREGVQSFVEKRRPRFTGA